MIPEIHPLHETLPIHFFSTDLQPSIGCFLSLNHCRSTLHQPHLLHLHSQPLFLGQNYQAVALDQKIQYPKFHPRFEQQHEELGLPLD
ncbi:hypothetical protein Hdeb2414_s0006g00213761 [Helianthus debilis subsp. tardiflorus]